MKRIEKILIFFKKCADDAVGAYAAYAAFFVIVSFFPFLMLLLTLIQFLPFSAADISNYVNILMPESVTTMIKPMIDEVFNTSRGLISVTAIAAVWSASKAVYSLICGLNQVYNVRETRNLVEVRAMSIFYTIVFILVIAGSMILIIFGNNLFVWLEQYMPWVMYLSSFRYVIGLLVFILFFLTIFKALPNRKSTFSNELPGAVIAAFGWVAFSAIYSYYINHFSNFSLIYGSITAVVFIMLWLYFCMYITLLAAEINALRAKETISYNIWKIGK
ncbi:MAG: YihY/virulence factor BrkB family protein [Clostridiales bacterium]|nr:YihY/virulence factor BrkB family protein [Clostridiales bacterium]